MYKIDFARSMRRLEAALALRRGDVALASKQLAEPTAGPAEPEDYDAEFERRLDLALADRIVAAGGSRVVSDAAGTAWQPGADRQVAFAAFVRVIGTPSSPPETLAAVGRR
jgi:hypothetical protein